MNGYKALIILWASFILIGCHKDSDENPLDNGFLGTLTFEYARVFPYLEKNLTIDVEISKTGEITLTNPGETEYSIVDEVDKVIKAREEGTISVNKLSGKIVFIEKNQSILIQVKTQIQSLLTTWGWDEKLGWIVSQSIPAEVSDPVKEPLNFSIPKSILSGEDIQSVVTGVMGDVTYKWTLLLVPKLEH